MESDRLSTSIHPSSNRVYNKLSSKDKVMIRCLLGHLIGHTMEYDRVSTSIHASSNRVCNKISNRASRIYYRVSIRV